MSSPRAVAVAVVVGAFSNRKYSRTTATAAALGFWAGVDEALAAGVVDRGGRTVGELLEPLQPVSPAVTTAAVNATTPADIRRPPTNTGKA